MKKILLLSALFVPGVVFASEVSDGRDISCCDDESEIQSDNDCTSETIPPAEVVTPKEPVATPAPQPKEFIPPRAPEVVPAPQPEEITPPVEPQAIVAPRSAAVIVNRPQEPNVVIANVATVTVAIPPKHSSADNVFVATPKPCENTIETDPVSFDEIEAIKKKKDDLRRKALAKAVAKVKEGLDDFTQVEVYPLSAKPIHKTKSDQKDEVLASWTNDCFANAKPNADCKMKCCSPRVRGPIVRRGVEWFNMFMTSLINQEKARIAAEEEIQATSVKEPEKVLEVKEEDPIKDAISEGMKKKIEQPKKVNTAKSKPTGKKKVSLKKNKSWKKAPKKIEGPIYKAPVVKKTVDKMAELRAIINEAVIKMILGRDINTRLEGIATLEKYAPKTKGELKEYVEKSLLVFLDEYASIDRCKDYNNTPKTDIERVLALLANIYTSEAILDLTNMNFNGIKIEGLNFKHFDLSDSAFVGATIKNSNFSGVAMSGSDFSNANIENSDFSKAKLDGSYFIKTTINNSMFTDAKINCSQLRDSVISNNDFSGAVLSSVLFTDTVITDSKFSGADLVKADMHEITLKNNNFIKADLTGANLMKSKVDGDDFADAKFDKTYIKHTNMEKAKGFSFDMLIASYFDDETKVPEYLAATFSKTKVQSSTTFSCPVSACATRLNGLENHYEYLLNVSYKVLDDDTNVGHNNWALCNINCIIHAAPSYGQEALSKISSFVRKKSPWPPVSNYQASSIAKSNDIEGALYVIGNRPKALTGASIDLSNTDLRGTDFYGYDMNGVDFSGSNLRGALTTDANGMPRDTTFTIPTNNS